MNTADTFAQIMREHYTTDRLVGMSKAVFRSEIDALLNLRDGNMEGYQDLERQRDLSIRFHWGHNHDFGDFQIEGRMGWRHLGIPALFVDRFQALPLDLRGARVLDIGVWTGGTSLLFAALGAEVVAIEEVKKYADAVALLKRAFDVQRLTVLSLSLYELNDPQFFDQFDYVFFSGVLYHVTDPIIALRIAFNALKDGGTCLLETYGIEHPDAMVRYDGPAVFGAGSKDDLSRGGWNWFLPSRTALGAMLADVGFQAVDVGPVEQERISAVARRTRHADMLRAGLSVRTIR
jgi:SAM-dependent methyltransferase